MKLLGHQINRRKFMAGVGSSALTSLSGCKQSVSAQNPPFVPHHTPKNIIFIVADTFRYDYLGANGNSWIHTPNLDKLASESVSFTQCYADGLPTIPARRVFFTGNSVLPDSAWIPLNKTDITIAEILTLQGYLTGFITDVYHYFKPEMNFHRGFRSFQWIRGQEEDLWQAGPRDIDTQKYIPAHHWTQQYHYVMLQYLMNTHQWKGEDDFFCTQTCKAAMQWLDNRRYNQPFFLYVDLYDPHEPWDAPKRFKEMYRKTYPLERYLFGYGVNWKNIKQEDIPILRDLYAAEVTFTDHCLGKLLNHIHSLGLLKDTLIVFTSDHGTHLGEDGCVQKRPGYLNSCITHIPLIIRHPDSRFAGKQMDQLVSALDITPTILDLVNIKAPEPMDGHSVWPLVLGEKASIRDEIVCTFFSFAMIRNKEWHYFQHFKGSEKGHGPCLYNLKDDPQEKWNVYSKFPGEVLKIKKRLETKLQLKLPGI